VLPRSWRSSSKKSERKLASRSVKHRSVLLYLAISVTIIGQWCVPCQLAASDTSDPSKPLGVDACVKIALKNNLQILKKELERQAQTYRAKATLKDMLPSLDTDYSYTGRRDAATIVIFGRSTTIYGHDEYKWNLNVRQPLFYGGLLWNRFKKAQIEVDLAELALFQAQNQIIRETKKSYYEVLKTKKLVEEAQAQLHRLKAQYETVKAFFEASLKPKTDLLQSQVQLNQGKLALIKARNQYELAKNRLNIVMKRSLESPLNIKEKIEIPELSISLKHLYNMALTARPELKQAHLAVQKAQKQVKIALSDYWPKVDLTASYSKDGVTPDVSDNPYGDHENAQVFLTAKWELFSWGKSRDKIIAAKKMVEAAEVELEDLTNRVKLEIKNAYLLYEDAKEGVNVARSALQSAKEDYELNVSRYKNQLASNTDVLNAQSRLTKARSDFISAVAAQLAALAEIEYAVGRGITECTRSKK